MAQDYSVMKSSLNPGFGKLFLGDYISLAYVVLRLLLYEIPSFVLRFFTTRDFSHSGQCSFTTQLWRFVIRTANEHLSIRLIRSLIRSQSSIILSSKRYRRHCQNLYQPVSRPGFAGYWIIQGSFSDPQRPRASDITIFFLHGGGYFNLQVETYLLFLLRLAESLIAQGLSVSIFALEYHLAPEHRFPTQLNEARAAYSYLLNELAINPSKLILAGDSAGGHLALSLLVSLQDPSPFPENLLQSAEAGKAPPLPKPAALVLLSPWLSLHTYSRTPAMHTDVNSIPFLERAGAQFLGPYPTVPLSSPLIEFLAPDPAITWHTVLPAHVQITAGDEELMFGDIFKWGSILERELGRERVDFTAGVSEVHDWQWLETITNEPAKKRFLAKEVVFTEEGLAKDCESIGLASKMRSKAKERDGKAMAFEGVLDVGRAIGEVVRRKKTQ